jgi:type VI secretion system protein ImpH
MRIGQAPSSSFEPTAIAAFGLQTAESPAQLTVGFFGLWGPHGALPTHFTEYARDRLKHRGDATLTSFVDLFHHRMLLLFHRAWAKAQPTAAMDRPTTDAFATYVGAFVGLALDATRGRDPFPDRAKLYYAGRFASSPRNAEGLREVVADYFGLPTAIEEFVGEWLDLPLGERWELGTRGDGGILGSTTVLGGRVWARSHKFRIVIGPLSRRDFDRTLPSSEAIATLSAIVRLYTNDEWGWDVRLVLTPEATEPMRLGRGARLGWTTRIGRSPGVREDLIVDPVTRRTHREQVPLSLR